MNAGDRFPMADNLATIIDESEMDERYLLAALHRRALDVGNFGYEGRVLVEADVSLLVPEGAPPPFDGRISISGRRVEIPTATFKSGLGEISLEPYYATQSLTIPFALPQSLALARAGRWVDQCIGNSVLGIGRIRIDTIETLPEITRIILAPSPPVWREWPEPLPEGSGKHIQIEEGKQQ